MPAKHDGVFGRDNICLSGLRSGAVKSVVTATADQVNIQTVGVMHSPCYQFYTCICRQSNSDLGGIDLGLAGTDAEQSSDGGFEKRYSGAKHTSQNSQSRDRAAVRKLFSLLVGKRYENITT